MQNTNQRIRASKISPPQWGFFLIWHLLSLSPDLKGKAVSIHTENKLIKICLKIGVGGPPAHSYILFQVDRETSRRLNGVSSSTWELLRRDKLDEVDLLKWNHLLCEAKMDVGLILWYLEPELQSLNSKLTKRGEGAKIRKMVSKTSHPPLLFLLLLLVSNLKSSDSKWLMPAISMFHAAIAHDWCLLSTYTLGGGWTHLWRPLESNTFCCGNLQNALRVKAPWTSALISAFKDWEIWVGYGFAAWECEFEYVFPFHEKCTNSGRPQRLIWLARWHYCHFLQPDSLLCRIFHLSPTQLSTQNASSACSTCVIHPDDVLGGSKFDNHHHHYLLPRPLWGSF